LPVASVSINNGIQIDYRNRRYLLDPKGSVPSDFTFVSHAHLDHVHRPKRGAKVLASKETTDLAQARGYDLGETVDQLDSLDLLDSGHILGSRALRIGDEVLYTGDAAGRERAFLGKCRTRRARILITETTYGSPEYVFPSTAKLVRAVNTLISETFDKGKPVVLMGYPLGKAQLLCYFFSAWGPLYLHKSVARMNEVHRKYGIELKRGKTVDPAGSAEEDLSPGPWLMVTPVMSGSSRFLARLKRRYGAVIVAFSGWATDSGYRHYLGADYAFPLSDHCDYAELLRLVQEVAPEVVYTTHGHAQEFARDLKRLGYAARSLASYQSSLYDYVREA
jgi:putative mRNA 3-end processing factor